MENGPVKIVDLPIDSMVIFLPSPDCKWKVIKHGWLDDTI